MVLASVVLVSCSPSDTSDDALPLHGAVGVSTGSFVLDDPPSELGRELDVIRDLGATWLRIDLDWSAIQPTADTYDWGPPDRVITAAKERGLFVLALPNSTPRWARPPGTEWNHPPVRAADFARFVSAAVTRYAGMVDAWEIWNEPNSSAFWAPQPDPAAYAALLAAAAPVIRAGDPGAPVVAGGTAPGADSPTGLHLSPVTFLRGIYAAGAGPYFDAAATHPYTFPDLPDVADADNGFGEVVGMQRVLAENGNADRLVWLTEFGAPTGTDSRAVTPRRQSYIIVRGIETATELPGTGPLFLYSTRDRGTDTTDRLQNFGLTTVDFTPKPALDAVRTALGQAGSRGPTTPAG